MAPQIVVAFDLYGTLLSTSSIAEELGKHFGKKAAGSIASTWRAQQLEYTWRLNSMQQYLPFSTVTRRSLGHALRAYGKSLDAASTDLLMDAYNSLSTFPDVAGALHALASNPSILPVIFSNGTQDMVSSSVNKSADLSLHSSVFKDIVTIEEAGCFKPSPEVYKYLGKRVGKEDRPGEMWLVSGNPFDVVGARSIGMQTAWVDREGNGWQDGLLEGADGQPTVIVRTLGDVAQKVEEWIKNNHK